MIFHYYHLQFPVSNKEIEDAHQWNSLIVDSDYQQRDSMKGPLQLKIRIINMIFWNSSVNASLSESKESNWEILSRRKRNSKFKLYYFLSYKRRYKLILHLIQLLTHHFHKSSHTKLCAHSRYRIEIQKIWSNFRIVKAVQITPPGSGEDTLVRYNAIRCAFLEASLTTAQISSEVWWVY